MPASSREIHNILQAVRSPEAARGSMALATVVDVEGSAYRRTGARMLIRRDGKWFGAISGGCLEGNALRRAREVIRTGTAQLVTYDTRSDESAREIGASLGCNGVVRVRIEPLDAPGTMETLASLEAAFAGEKEDWIFRLVGGPAEGRVVPGSPYLRSSVGEVNALLRTLLRTEEGLQTAFVDGARCVFAVERVLPAIRLLIFGGGYDAAPLAQLGHEMGWHVTVTDECPARALPARFPPAKVLQLDREAAADALRPNAFTAAVLISHNYGYDMAVLESLLRYDLPYIGVLGPKKRFRRMDEETGGRLAGHPAIHAPVGLDIGAQTPFEIALAVTAEIRAVFAGRKGGPLRERKGPIHARKAVAQ